MDLKPVVTSESRAETGDKVHLLDSAQSNASHRQDMAPPAPTYKVYKRRFLGLSQLILLNIIVSWDWLSFAPVSKTSSQYFRVTEGVINWLSTAFLFAFVAATPATIWTLNRKGPKAAIVTTACFILVGNWVRYAGTRAGHGNFGVVMFGQIIIGFSQPFCLTAPTRYSDLWFSEKGRVTATMVASLANPFGGALVQLINPLWASKPSQIPNMILYTSIISTIACVPAFFIPSQPPTPSSAGSTSAHQSVSLSHHLRSVVKVKTFWLIAIPYWVYVGFFNAFTSVLNQILEPYGVSEDNAGIAGAILIVVGLIAAAITSPITDKYKCYLLVIKICIPILSISYLIFIWMPQTSRISLAGPYIICALLGASSFCTVPVALEFLVEILHPISPEVSSTLCWVGGQFLGAIFIIIMNALKATGPSAHPKANMKKSLIFEAVIAVLTTPLPLLLGTKGFETTRKRLEVEKRFSTGPLSPGGGLPPNNASVSGIIPNGNPESGTAFELEDTAPRHSPKPTVKEF